MEGNLEKCLAETMGKSQRVRLEITLNYPRTKPFMRMSTNDQIQLYRNIFDLYRMSTPHKVLAYEQTYETSADMAMHSHCYIDLEVLYPFSVEGLVTGCLRFLVFQMPKRNHQYLARCHYNYRFECYRTPSVLVQYTPYSDKLRLLQWQTYIHKEEA